MNAVSLSTRLPHNPFWEFSLEIYGREGVSAACLGLQDEIGADVNMLLFCCWTAAGGVCLDDDKIRQALAAIKSWQTEIVQPLRTLRRRLRQGFDGVAEAQSQALRRAIQAIEIDAEQLEQLRLVAAVPVKPDTAPRGPDRAAEAAGNLMRYLTMLGVDRGDIPYQHLSVLLVACFPELPEAEIRDLLRGNQAR